MLQLFSETFHLAYRQEWALARGFEAIKNAFGQGFSFRRLLAAVLTLIQGFNFFAFETPLPAAGQALDLTGYELVFCDEFDGNALDTDAWYCRGVGARRAGYNAESQIAVKDGVLAITAEYREDGAYGPGWYVGAVALKERYCRGYFEIRCIVSDSEFWSAFWLQGSAPYNHTLSAGGVGSAEIDIFEAMSADKKGELKRNAVTTTIHCNGWDDDEENIDSRQLGDFRGSDIYNTYNTYGLEWTEDEYIFYINGVETTRSSFGRGVSTEPEEVIVSVECPGELPYEPGRHTAAMLVDYVKIYQKP